MNESTIDVLLVIIDVVIIAMTGVLAGWVWGYGAGFRKATKPPKGKPRDLAASRPIKYWCPECGAPLTNHCPGCPYDTEENRALSRV